MTPSRPATAFTTRRWTRVRPALAHSPAPLIPASCVPFCATAQPRHCAACFLMLTSRACSLKHALPLAAVRSLMNVPFTIPSNADLEKEFIAAASKRGMVS